MATPDLYTARNDLFACLDIPVERLPPPLSPDTGFAWRELANRLIGLAERFVAALEEAGGGEELNRRKVLLENITGAPYQRLREAAYQRLRRAFKVVLADQEEVERIPISQLTELHMPEQFAQRFLVRDDVRRFAGDPEAILWSPFKLNRYWSWLAQLVKDPELVEFSCEVSEVVRQIEREHLWGSFLLTESREVSRSSMPDRYRNLLAAIVDWDDASAAIRQAAESLFMSLHVDPGQLRKEQRQILVAMLEMGAFSVDDLKATSAILKKALNSSKTDKYKEMMSDLCHRGLVQSKEGAGGGYWLTPIGRSIAGKVREAEPILPVGATSTGPMVPGAGPRLKSPAPAASASQSGSPPVTEEERAPGFRVEVAKSPQKDGDDRQSRDAGTSVSEFLQDHAGATEEQVLAGVLAKAPHLSTSSIVDSLHDRSRFTKQQLGSGRWGFFIAETAPRMSADPLHSGEL